MIRYFDDHQILPNIKIFERDGELNEDNYELMEKIALNRMDGGLISDDALDLAIKSSGGILQDFIRIIRNSANVASGEEKESIDREDVERIISNIRNDYLRGLVTEHFEILRRIKSEHNKSEYGKSDEETFRDLLYNLVILEYSNYSIWYDVHPAIKGILE